MRTLKKTTKRKIAFTVLFIIELIGGTAGGAITAAILLPSAYAESGYWSVDESWLIIALVAFGTFYAIHSGIFKFLGEEARR